MKSIKLVLVLLVAAVVAVPSSVAAQPKVEVGGSLASMVIGVGDNNEGKIFGVPSATFGLFNPGVYASFFVGPNFAVEPQLGALVVSNQGNTEHIVSVAAQADFFFNGVSQPSPYVFASGGIIDSSSGGTTPKSVSGGLGYRFPVGDRLAFRLDGRYVHFTESDGNAVVVGLSIGGVFGR